ncbi:MAG: PstS family phosphate ABC transporter substrate-binding protein [Chloroflexi bacterium]|nr:PstS family phosphate ABC transporter substrate-binding protein [Chloroflexota bacterium]
MTLTAALLLACGNDKNETSTNATPGAPGAAATTTGGQQAAAGKPVEPANKADLAKLKGDIVIDGSSTVYPVTAAAAEEFRKYAKDVRTSVGISGTGGGFKKFCNGETDIQDASRPIDPAEVEQCKAKNIDYIELPVAFDGLAVVVSPKNTFVTCLTKAELKKIWEPEAQGKITNWKQVRDSFPDKPLKLFGAGTDSGTFDYFTQAINGKEKASRGDFQASEDDNVLVQGVSNDENALGYFGYAYVVENQGKVKAIQVDDKGDGKCVAPSIETVKNGSYQPLSRPIFIYVKKSSFERPEVKTFASFYLSKSFTPLIQTREVGYIALDDKYYEAITKRLNAGTIGTLFPKGAEVGASLDRYLQ